MQVEICRFNQLQRRQGKEEVKRVKKVKDISEWGFPDWRALLQGKEFTDDDDDDDDDWRCEM